MRRLPFLFALSLLCSWPRLSPASVQDGTGEIFPALPSAHSADHWQGGYFYLNGQPTFISSGSIHYSRVPRELWRDRIWRLQQMGFNCVQSYVFWNASEPKQGQWDFSDNVDLDAWLTLLHQMGMYALVRVGPYSCAEWEGGGYPAWATVQPGIVPREMGQPFLQVSDPQVSRVEDITAKHQINHGGSVILVQLENEHSRGWGTDVDDPYLKYLDDQARAHGIEVPMFNSGLHHSQEPSGETPFPPDPSPWYSTEFWTGWIGKYGEMTPGTISEKIRGTWKIIAFGGAGYNYYMAHGGTNLGYSGDSLASSYDYSAPIGEAGQLRQFYYLARRAAYFAQSFTPLLAGSHNNPSLVTCDQPDIRVTTRTNPTGGSIVFLDHFLRKGGPVAAILPEAAAYHAPKADPNVILNTRLTVGGVTLPSSGSLKVAPVEPRTVLLNLPWTANATFQSICTNVLLRKTIGSIDYWVCYGAAGDSGEINVSRRAADKSLPHIAFTYPTDASVKEINVDSGDGHQAKFLVMNTEMTDRTWFAHGNLYVGPTFVLENGDLEFPVSGGKATVYSPSGRSEITQPSITESALPVLTGWTWRDGATERAPALDVTKWLSSTGPQPMETYDSYQNRYGWYRTVLHRDADDPLSLHLANQSGTLTVFVNGELATSGTFANEDSATLILPHVKAGDNSLAILVKASPRSKNVSGLIGYRNARGIWGGVSTDQSSTPLAISWKSKKGLRDAVADDLAKPGYDDSSWDRVDASTPVAPIIAPRGNSWYRGVFTVTPAQIDSFLETPVFSTSKSAANRNGTKATTLCYLNGHLVKDRVQDASKFLVPGQNMLLLEVQSRLGGDAGPLAFSVWHNSPLSQATWYFHPGLDDLEETAVVGRVTNWGDFLTHQPWQASQAAPGQPGFWKCRFTYHSPTDAVQTLGLVTDGLKSGHVWLNGHNLGECPQTVLMYVPECWLKDGENDLVVFDLEGQKPDQVKLARYESFSLAAAKQPTATASPVQLGQTLPAQPSLSDRN